MRWSFHHLRIRALQLLARAVRQGPKPSLPLGGYLVQALAFESPSDAARFILACGGVLVEVEEGGSGGGGGGAQQLLPPEFRLVLDCKASVIEMVREVTEEEKVFRGAGLADYLKAAVAVAP